MKGGGGGMGSRMGNKREEMLGVLLAGRGEEANTRTSWTLLVST